ncbi:MAG: hypothetical protein R3183_09045 [Oleiphilaceae bacterium]|nr:hypothetical protein [Oleiphilaceae bacterium]
MQIAVKLFAALFLSFGLVAMSSAENKSKKNPQAVETVGEVSIIGNTELPNVTFNLPWRLPTIENRAEQSPPTELPNMLQSIEPVRHKQRVYFSRFLQLEVSEFSKR